LTPIGGPGKSEGAIQLHGPVLGQSFGGDHGRGLSPVKLGDV